MDGIYVVVAELFEMVWAVGLKYTEGISRPWPSVWTIAAMIAGFYFLSQVLKIIPVGKGYAVWTGIGAARKAILGIVLFVEPAAPLQLVSAGLIAAGIVGLRVTL